MKHEKTQSLFAVGDLKTQLPDGQKQKTAARNQAEPETKLSKVQASLTDAIGELEKDQEMHFVSCSQWSTHNLIDHILTQIGPAEITAATWSMSQPAAEQIMTMLHAGRILSLSLLLDWRVKVRTPEALDLARENCAKLRLASCHAKVCIITNHKMAVSIVGSANFTNNPRIEAGAISTFRSTADFHLDWLNREIEKASPFAAETKP